MTDNMDKLTKLTRDVMTAFTERYTEAPEAFAGGREQIIECWLKMGMALGAGFTPSGGNYDEASTQH